MIGCSKDWKVLMAKRLFIVDQKNDRKMLIENVDLIGRETSSDAIGFRYCAMNQYAKTKLQKLWLMTFDEI